MDTNERTPRPEAAETYTLMTADIYDAIYVNKDYESEAKNLKKLISHYKKTNGNELLDVACGTGLHLPYILDDFNVTGIDLSSQQIEGARKRLPNTPFLVGDMRDFDLQKQYDVVTCLFSSIGYVYPYEEMEKAVANMAKHLKPGGVLLIEPWLEPGVYDASRPPHTETTKHPTKDIEVTRTAHAGIDGTVSVMKMEHEVKTPDGTKHFTEEHRLALYTPEEFRSAFEAAGLKCIKDEAGLQGPEGSGSRGIYIGQQS